jgi:hypothetical protein
VDISCKLLHGSGFWCPMTTDTFQSPAWLLSGLTRSHAGILEYTGGRLAYSSEEGVVFDVALTELTNVRFPWYYFTGGVKFTIGRDHYRISFVRPNDASGGSVADIGEGRRNGKAWKAILLPRWR